MLKFSVIIPVFNRPDELRELLLSLTRQTLQIFEVIIVEDGSVLKSDNVVQDFRHLLPVQYFYKKNSGPGLSRNYGAEKAQTDFFIFLDSDCILPEDYFQNIEIFNASHDMKCFGGPDKAHPDFSPIQKAINYSMTSFLTTGGIRGGKKKVIKFHPRSFNMGFSRIVFQKTGGFRGMRFGEDIDLSLRIEKEGFKCYLIENAYVFHKRRTDFKKFFKQIYNSGIARINLFKLHPTSLKATHFAPAIFTLYLFISLVAGMLNWPWLSILLLIYLLVIFGHATVVNVNVWVGFLSVIATLVQMISYGTGFLLAFFSRIVLGKKEFSAFEENFYK